MRMRIMNLLRIESFIVFWLQKLPNKKEEEGVQYEMSGETESDLYPLLPVNLWGPWLDP
jgi:hypothetical protein